MVLSIVVFAMIRLIPGDPVTKLFDTRSHPTPEQINALRAQLGLDGPWPLQYLRWVGGIVHGDFGQSVTQPFSVGDQLAARFPLSAELAVLAAIVAVAFGIPLGAIGGSKAGSARDGVVRALSFTFLSTPTFLLAIFLILLNSRTLKWDVIGFARFEDDPLANLRLMALPAILLGLGLGAYLSRYTRSGLIDDLERPHVRTLRAIGTPHATIVTASLRNAMIPVSTVLAIELGGLVGGTVVIEKIFAIPGLGSFLMDAIKQSDYPSIQGAILVVGAIYIAMNLVVDLAYPVIDPRVQVTP